MSNDRDDRPILTDEQIAIGVAELQLEGLIEFNGEEEYRPTDKGIDLVLELVGKLGPKNVLAIMSFIMSLYVVSFDDHDNEK